MNTNERKPIIICPSKIERTGSTFYLPEKRIKINAPIKLLKKLIGVCDGSLSFSQIINQLSQEWDKDNLVSFMNHLENLGIIHDAVSLSGYFWSFAKNPTRLYKSVTDRQIAFFAQKANKRHERKESGQEFKIIKTDLQELLEKRRSIRTFSNQTVNQNIVNALLWSGYGIVGDHLIIDKQNPQRRKVWQQLKVSRHTVPSAGALYPFRIGLVLLKSTDVCERGLYEVCFGFDNSLKLVKINDSCLPAYQGFADPTICNQAQGVIVIAGSFSKCSEKYGNRSMLYVPLEAGHIAQNIHLAATEYNLGTVEVGGFIEDNMREAFKFPNDYYPLTTILFGFPADNNQEQPTNNDIEVSWSTSRTRGYKLPFLMAFAKPKSWKNDSACGRSIIPELAKIKALSEAEEWSACGRIPNNMIISKPTELPEIINPRELISFHSKQYQRKLFPLHPLKARQDYHWIQGRNHVSGRNVLILSDMIFFPYHPSYPRYCFANSSGTATHYDRKEAIQSATLELIERDAFMICYLNKLEMPSITNSDLPSSIQLRIRALNRAGFRVVIKDFTLDLAPVAFVFAQHERLSFTTCAGCCDFDFTKAINHALMEVEAAAFCRLSGQATKPISYYDVRMTDDHGNIYEQQRYFRRADFLGSGSKKIRYQEIGKSSVQSWQELVDRLVDDGKNISIIDLPATNGVRATDFKTVKVFISGIVPISFGYGVEPLGMQRIYDLPVQLKLLNRPKTYVELYKFPHPYT